MKIAFRILCFFFLNALLLAWPMREGEPVDTDRAPAQARQDDLRLKNEAQGGELEEQRNVAEGQGGGLEELKNVAEGPDAQIDSWKKLLISLIRSSGLPFSEIKEVLAEALARDERANTPESAVIGEIHGQIMVEAEAAYADISIAHAVPITSPMSPGDSKSAVRKEALKASQQSEKDVTNDHNIKEQIKEYWAKIISSSLEKKKRQARENLEIQKTQASRIKSIQEFSGEKNEGGAFIDSDKALAAEKEHVKESFGTDSVDRMSSFELARIKENQQDLLNEKAHNDQVSQVLTKLDATNWDQLCVSIRERFGPVAQERYKNYFYSERVDNINDLNEKKLESFVSREIKREKQRFDDSRIEGSWFFSNNAEGIAALNKLYEESKSQPRLGVDGGKQIHLDDPSIKEEEMAKAAVTKIEEAIMYSDDLEFTKELSALKRKDLAKKFKNSFQDQYTPLTVEALKSFFKNQNEIKKQSLNKAYYYCLSRIWDYFGAETYKNNQQIWSIGQATVSSLKAQPFLTKLGDEIGLPEYNAAISTSVSVSMSWLMTVANDSTREWRKSPVATKTNEAVNKSSHNLAKKIEEVKGVYRTEAEIAFDQISNGKVIGASSDLSKDIIKERIKAHINQRNNRLRTFSQNLFGSEKILTEIESNYSEALEKLKKSPDPSINNAYIKLRNAGEKIKLSRYVLQPEVDELKAQLSKQEADLLSLEVGLPQGLKKIENLWSSSMESHDFLSKKLAAIEIRIQGEEALRKQESQNNNEPVDKAIVSEQAGLKELKSTLTDIQQTYECLANAYLLNYITEEERQKALENDGKANKIEAKQSPYFEQLDKLIIGSDANNNDKYIALSDTRYDKLETISQSENNKNLERTAGILKAYFENRYGLDAVKKLDHYFSIRGKQRLLTVREIKDFKAFFEKAKSLPQQDTSSSLYLSPYYSGLDLYHAPDSENKKILRSNGRKLDHNIFSLNSLPENYLSDNEATKEEGVRAGLKTLVEMEVFKNFNSFYQRKVLEEYEQKFQIEKKPLTVEAFKNFVDETKAASEKWQTRIYYEMRNHLKWVWSTLMSVISALRVILLNVPWEGQCIITYGTDVVSELTGNYRESGTYREHVKSVIENMLKSPERQPIDDKYYKYHQFESAFKDALDKKDYLKFSAWITENGQKLKNAKQAIEEKFLNNSAKEEIADLVEEDIKNASTQLDREQDKLAEIASNQEDNFLLPQNEKDYIAAMVSNTRKVFLLHQACSESTIQEMQNAQLRAANNQMRFKKLSDEMTERFEATEEEENQTSYPDIKTHRSKLKSLAENLKGLSENYNKLANGYAFKLMHSDFITKNENAYNFDESASKSENTSDYHIANLNGKLVVVNPEKWEEYSKHEYQQGIELAKLDLYNRFGKTGVEEFKKLENKLQGKLLRKSDLDDCISSLKKAGLEEAYFLSSGHSLEQILRAKYQDNRVIKASGKEGDETKAGLKMALEELKKIDWFRQLTFFQKERVIKKFIEKFIRAPKQLIYRSDMPEEMQVLTRSLGFKDSQQLEALTVNSFNNFIDEEKAINENWSFYYKTLDTPIAAALSWNVITGATVLARCNQDFIRCHANIMTTDHFFLIPLQAHTIHASCLTFFSVPFHFIPSLLTAYLTNLMGEQFNKQRQLPLDDPTGSRTILSGQTKLKNWEATMPAYLQ